MAKYILCKCVWTRWENLIGHINFITIFVFALTAVAGLLLLKLRNNSFIDSLASIAGLSDYYVLQSKAYPDHVRCLISLRPEQSISDVIKMIKTNSARDYNVRFSAAPPLWARGFLARSIGRVRLSAVRQYLNTQAEHHGYAHRVRPPVFRYRAKSRLSLNAAHSVFELSHHLVLSTRYRKGIFDSEVGAALGEYWLSVAAKRDFAVDQISILPDHVHLIVGIVPKMSIEECVLSLLNNGQYFIGKHYPQVLIKAGVDSLWQDSAYAGTSGQVTTAMVKSFLGRPE